MKDTPILIKREGDNPQSDEPLYYVLTADGLFIHRKNEYFTSCAHAKSGPGELANQKPSLELRYPKLSTDQIAQVVAFFDWASDKHGEVIVLLLHNTQTNQIELLIPEQKCSWASVEYDVPTDLPEHMRLIGDIHSHVRMAAFASWTDEKDETHRPGLHLVIGKVDMEPPEFYCVFVVDGERFEIKDLTNIMEGDYFGRTEFPKEWKKPCKKKVFTWTGYKYPKQDHGHGPHHHSYLGRGYEHGGEREFMD